MRKKSLTLGEIVIIGVAVGVGGLVLDVPLRYHLHQSPSAFYRLITGETLGGSVAPLYGMPVAPLPRRKYS